MPLVLEKGDGREVKGDGREVKGNVRARRKFKAVGGAVSSG